MDRTIERMPGGTRLRIWTPPDSPVGLRDDGTVSVELATGQPGHPSTYGLLGARAGNSDTTFVVPTNGEAFLGAAARAADVVQLGLPEEYRPGIGRVQPRGLVVTVAAHGRFSSSERMFGFLSVLLSRLLEHGVPEQDEAVWQLYREAAEHHRRLVDAR
jgi:hypothetical protein